jgi:hypothetical protein
MPLHHTFYVESGRPQYHTLQVPNNQIEPLRAPNNQTEPLRAPEENVRPVRLNSTRPTENEKPKKQYDLFQEELMKRVEKQNEKLEKAEKQKERAEKAQIPVAEPLENNSSAHPHRGLNISSSSLMTPPHDDQSPIYINYSEALYKSSNNYDSLRVVDLRELCRERGLAIYGSKEDIIQRLVANDSGAAYTRKYTKKGKDNQTK